MLAIVAFGFATGCSDDDRVTGGTVNGNGVYFPTTFNPTISLAENQSSVVVPVHRTVDATDFSMPILLVEEAGKEGFFTCDSQALFKAGSKESSVTLRFDPDAVEVGESYYCNLLLSDDTNAANYGLTSLEISIMFDPWKRLGVAYWRDDIFGNLFGHDELYPETECVAYEHMNIKGYYKIQEVYTPAFAGGMFGATAEQFAGNVNGTEAIYIDATNPDRVIMEYSETGFIVNEEYGYMVIMSDCDENGVTNSKNLFGTLKNGVIKFPAGGLFLYMPASGSLYRTNADGLTRVVLPGAVALEPAVEVDYRGIMLSPELDVTAIFDVAPNDDAAKVRWAVAEASTDVNAMVAGMLDGSVECEVLTSEAQVEYAIEEEGEFVAVFIPSTEDDAVVGTPVIVSFDYTSSGVTAKDFTAEIVVEPAAFTATYTITPNSDKILYYYWHYPKAMYEAIIAEFGAIDVYEIAGMEEVAASNGVSLQEVISAFSAKGVVEEDAQKLEPETDYVVFAYAIDANTGAAKSPVTLKEFTTTVAPTADADYEKFIGTWNITSSGMLDTKGNQGEPITFPLVVVADQPNYSYKVVGWDGDQNFTMNNVAFTANYQAADAANELPALITFSGEVLQSPLFDINPYGACAPTMMIYVNAGGAIQMTTSALGLFGFTNDAGTSGQILCNVLQGQDGSEVPVLGMGAAFYIVEGDYAGYYLTQPFSVGPYTMEKVSSDTASVKSIRTVDSRFKKLVKNCSVVARREYILSNNLVMNF